MAITLEANYSKKLGLPGFSSHAYSITVRTEVTDLSEIQTESERLYHLLQVAVDQEIRNTGWLPDQSNNGNGNGNHRATRGAASTHTRNGSNGAWNCSEKQQELILKIVDEHKLSRDEVNDLATQRFEKGVRELNRMEASGLIDELFHRCGSDKGGRSRKSHAFYRNGNTSARRAS